MAIGHDVTVAVEWIEMLFNVSGVLVPDGYDGSAGDANPNGGRGRGRVVVRRDGDPEDGSATVCNVGCKVDGVARVGYPERVFGTPGPSSGAVGTVDRSSGGLVGLSSVLLVVVVEMVLAWV